MNLTHDSLPIDRAVLEAAADWYALLSSGRATERDQSNWREWLDRHAAHRGAWQRVEAVSQQFQPIMTSRVERAASVAGLEAAADRRRQRRSLVKSFAFLGSAGVLAWGGVQTPPGQRLLAAARADHVTGVGGFEALTLEDGTQVWLNTDTALRVDYHRALRQLTLLRGEVSIATAHDTARPFMVLTGEGRFQALGTRFNVFSADGQTTLSVSEGLVRARFAQDGAASHDVGAGRQVRGGPQGVFPIVAASAEAAAWTRRLLQVEEMPLAAVIAQLARYRAGYLGCSDAVATLSVSGTFPLDDIDRALSMLTRVLPVRIRAPMPWWTTIQLA